jgi:hypothetical protein
MGLLTSLDLPNVLMTELCRNDQNRAPHKAQGRDTEIKFIYPRIIRSVPHFSPSPTNSPKDVFG